MSLALHNGKIYKYCPDCKGFTSINNFHKNKSRMGGLATYCKKHIYLRKVNSQHKKIIRDLKDKE